jgi:hypothetical protein
MKNPTMGGKLFHAGGGGGAINTYKHTYIHRDRGSNVQTDMTGLIIAFRNFAETNQTLVFVCRILCPQY